MTNKIEVPRELLERVAQPVCRNEDLKELRALLANSAAPEDSHEAMMDRHEAWKAGEAYGIASLSPDHSGGGAGMVLPELDPAFEAWWESDGQYCRAGGGSYEKTFAYRAYEAAIDKVKELNQ